MVCLSDKGACRFQPLLLPFIFSYLLSFLCLLSGQLLVAPQTQNLHTFSYIPLRIRNALFSLLFFLNPALFLSPTQVSPPLGDLFYSTTMGFSSPETTFMGFSVPTDHAL